MHPDLFNYSSPLDLFERLKRQKERLDTNRADEDHAFDFCLTAWSLADWDFYFKNPDLVGKKENQAARDRKHRYREEIFQLCEGLIIMHDIANGIKHFSLSKPKSNIDAVEFHDGGFDYTFDSTFEKSHIRIKFDDGEWLDLIEIADTVFHFWGEFLNKGKKP